MLKTGALGAGLAASPLAAQGTARGFTHGVASGEPSVDGVLLWTRYLAMQDTQLVWQILTPDANRRVIAEGQVTAAADRDWCAKVRATGLEPGRWYYYRFVAPDGTMSDLGRTRTLPVGPVDRFRMAVFSCSNMGFGWFNGYAHAAEANAFDLVYHAGDYFYEYAPGTYPAFEQSLPSRNISPDREIVALADYRLRYATYRADRDLQRLHQLYPMIAGWDDHESANDSYASGAENHQPDTEGDWNVRKQVAMRAYREWMPVSDENWSAYEIGDLATIFRLETRLTNRGQPPSLQAVLQGRNTTAEMESAMQAFRDGAYRDPSRELLGAEQQNWLAGGMIRSRGARKVWQVAAQQVLMGSLSSPVALADALTDEVPAFVRDRVRIGALASRNGLPLNMDAWDGYPAARERVLAAALAADANFISLAGDTHNAWAFDLSHGGERAGVEFGGQSVTSPGFEGYLNMVAPADMARALVGQNDQLAWADTARRGYMAVELTPQRATSEYRFLDTVRQRSTRLAGTHTVGARAGERQLERM